MAQKIVQYQAVLQLAQTAPQLYNLPLLHRQMLEVLNIKDAEKLVPMPEDQRPEDPITENQSILMGKPVKAFAYQDHKAHITIHMSAMQDPKIMQLLQGNPMAQQMQASMMNHINEHLGMEYRKQIELQLGFNLPPQEDESGEEINMNPEVEARLGSDAWPKLHNGYSSRIRLKLRSSKHNRHAQDPIVQMQQQELQIKMAEQQRKAAKDQVDAQLTTATTADRDRSDHGSDRA
jgi:hypothetical protein